MCFVMVGLVASSCGAGKNIASSNAAAYAAGSSCAQALTGLNSSRTANGTISLTNTNDLANMLTVCTAYSQLRNNKEDASYKTSFTNGLIAGSNIINASNATALMNGLLSATGLEGVNAQNISAKIQTVSTILTLLNALK